MALAPCADVNAARLSLCRRVGSLAVGLLGAWLIVGLALPVAARPNVVLILCDDLNDYVEGLDGHPQARTPELRRLADSGVTFCRAYSNNPVCAPSRSSFLTGIYCHESGNLFWNKWFQNPVLRNSRTMMEHFRANGYETVGTGKIMHHLKRDVWTHFHHEADYGPVVYDGRQRVAHPGVPQPFQSIGAIDGSYASLGDVPFADDANPQSGWIYGRWGKQVQPYRYASDDDRDPTPDERNAAWAAQRLRQFAASDRDQPFFLAVGFIRPHTPLHVPQKYFDLFPLSDVQLPVIQPDDAADTHLREVVKPSDKGRRYFRLLSQSYSGSTEGLRAFTQAYLASVAAVDDCVGEVIRAVDGTSLKENTIVIVTSDHGWQMGQKDFLFKNSPWEEATRVPLFIRAPGVTPAGGVAESPVSLIDLYPTLVDLCGLEGSTMKNKQGKPLDGHSLRPLLQDPAVDDWTGPEAALSMVYAGDAYDGDLSKQHWSLRTRRWRYIRYGNGAEELYDHDADPREWVNLADDPAHDEPRRRLSAMLWERLQN